MWTMDPPPRSRMVPATILVSTKAPTRLIRSTSAKSSAVTFSSGALRRTAAEFTSTSTPPHSRRVSDTRRATSASTPTSPASACPTPPAASMACATSWSGSGLRPNRATRAPSRAKQSATARPMPVPPPATSATLPSSAPIGSPAGVELRAVGGARPTHRAGAAARRPRGAPRGPEVHQGLVVVVGLARWHQRAGQVPHRLLPAQPRQAARAQEHAAEHPADIGVDDRHRPPVGEASHRAGGVAADPPHRPQRLLVVGQPPAVARDRLARDAVQVERPDVVPERVPEPLHVIGGGGGERLERRVAIEELVVLGHHPIDLRLLQHDLGDQDVIGILGAPPRQIAPVPGIPGEEAPPEADPRPAVGQGGRRHGGHCVRGARLPASWPQVDSRPAADNNEPCPTRPASTMRPATESPCSTAPRSAR